MRMARLVLTTAEAALQGRGTRSSLSLAHASTIAPKHAPSESEHATDMCAADSGRAEEEGGWAHAHTESCEMGERCTR